MSTSDIIISSVVIALAAFVFISIVRRIRRV